MKLSKTLTTLSAGVLALIATGCSDWLDYTPKDKQPYEQQFSTIDGFHTSVNGIYTAMSSTSLYGYNLSYGPIDIMGLCYKVSDNNQVFSEYKSASYTGTYASSTLTTIWSKAYNTILNINLVLQAIEEFPNVLTPDDRDLIEGEMLAARAFIHFDLVRLFGPVYALDPAGESVPFADDIEVIKRPCLPADEMIADKLLPDIARAQQLLLGVDPAVNEGRLLGDGGTDGNWLRYRQLRFNYYAVTLLKARVHLWAGDYENALVEARKITDDPKVKELFPFVDPTKVLGGSADADRIFSTECLYGFYKDDMENIYKNTFNGTLNEYSLLQPRTGYLNELFSTSADYRRQSQWIGSAGSGGGVDFIKYKSFTTDETNPEFWGTFFGLMRVSEAYYIAAEAAMNVETREVGIEYLNTLLDARGVPALAARTSNSKLLKEIKLEYLREMRGEGQIFFMFKRFRQQFARVAPEFDAANENLNEDIPSVSARYNVPIPDGEKY